MSETTEKSATQIRNAVIESAELEFKEGNLYPVLRLSYGNEQQTFGGFRFYKNTIETAEIADQLPFAGVAIAKTLRVADVDSWSKLKGKSIRVKQNDERVEAIGHFLHDDWFSPGYEVGVLEAARDAHYVKRQAHAEVVHDLADNGITDVEVIDPA